jgi:hypothetical protein
MLDIDFSVFEAGDADIVSLAWFYIGGPCGLRRQGLYAYRLSVGFLWPLLLMPLPVTRGFSLRAFGLELEGTEWRRSGASRL